MVDELLSRAAPAPPLLRCCPLVAATVIISLTRGRLELLGDEHNPHILNLHGGADGANSYTIGPGVLTATRWELYTDVYNVTE